jgi:hypothetical protein
MTQRATCFKEPSMLPVAIYLKIGRAIKIINTGNATNKERNPKVLHEK